MTKNVFDSIGNWKQKKKQTNKKELGIIPIESEENDKKKKILRCQIQFYLYALLEDAEKILPDSFFINHRSQQLAIIESAAKKGLKNQEENRFFLCVSVQTNKQKNYLIPTLHCKTQQNTQKKSNKIVFKLPNKFSRVIR